MLNYSVKVGETAEDYPDTLAGQGTGGNPFPGLRPFTIDECHLFFGREGQVDEILLNLSRFRSVTVMGYSGSGKSSLMNCGVVPVLLGGFMTHTSPYWSVISTRPGDSPITNLANAIVNQLVQQGRIDEGDAQIHKSIINSVLRNGPEGLVDVCRYLQLKEGENIFFLIDQFEELFRFREKGDGDYANDATAYVNLILEAVRQTEVPIYVSINMRSDFIGECAVFPGLTQMINQSNYLVPQLTREQKRMAIEGPVAVGGGRISSRLLKRLLADIADHQDQLPILQHALMRTWDYWVANREQGEPIDIRHYNAVGKIGQALSLHANEAYEELTTREKEIAEILFKNVTERNQENQGLRRPCKVETIAELADASVPEVVKVIEEFRKPGRSFLMPGIQVPLKGASVIEISHESLMRIWSRLSAWVEEEFESAAMYKRIGEAAAMYQIGKTSLWRPPDLQLALNWQKKQKPTRTWAQRYDEAFERAIVFLDTSRITYEAELKNQEMLQKRMLRRARVTNIILVGCLLVAISMFFYGLVRQIEAERQKDNALEQTRIAESEKNNALRQENIADSARLVAEQAVKQNEELIAELQIALDAATAARSEAFRLLGVAKEQTLIAERETENANVQRAEAQNQYQRAEQALEDANRLLYLSVAQSMEAKSPSIDDKELAGLLAMQGYLFHTKYDGSHYDPYVFKGLYYAVAKQSGLNYNQITVPKASRNRMYALAVSRSGSQFYTTGNDGRIMKGDISKRTANELVSANPYPNRVLALSYDEQFLVNGSDSSALQVLNLSGGRTTIISGHKGSVTDIRFLPDDSGFISASSDKTLRFNDHRTGNSRLLITLPFSLRSIDISSDGKFLVGASTSGQVVQVNLTTNKYETLVDEVPNRVLAIAFHPKRNMIAYGVEVVDDQNQVVRGLVKLFDLETRTLVKPPLSGHKSGISDLEFSPDGLLLASAGLDRKLQMWVVDHEEDLPIEMDNNNGNIWKIGFTKDSNFLIASCNAGEIRVWPTDTRYLAEQICPKLTRNMSQEEWGLYVGNGLPYEFTCKSIVIKDF